MVRWEGLINRSTGLAEQSAEYVAARAGVIGVTGDLSAFVSFVGARVTDIWPSGFEWGQPDIFE